MVSDKSHTTRSCGLKSLYNWSGCQTITYQGRDNSEVCVCNTELCNGSGSGNGNERTTARATTTNGNGDGNGAVMTSSVGHVIVVVALIISVITGYLM